MMIGFLSCERERKTEEQSVGGKDSKQCTSLNMPKQEQFAKMEAGKDNFDIGEQEIEQNY